MSDATLEPSYSNGSGKGVAESHNMGGDAGVVLTSNKSTRATGLATGIISTVDGIISVQHYGDDALKDFPVFIGYNICNPLYVDVDAVGAVAKANLWLYWS